VDDGWARLVVFGLGDPHGLEGRERSQDGATDPERGKYLRSGGAMILIFMVLGAKAVISFCIILSLFYRCRIRFYKGGDAFL
jgi:hypothetical protein